MSGGIRLRIQPRIPARVIGVAPVKAELTGSQLTIRLDTSDFAPVAGPVGPTMLSLLQDPADGTWKVAPVSGFFAVAGTVPTPTPVQVRQVLLSSAPGVWGWNPILRGDISDAGGYGKALLATETQSAAQTSLGIPDLLATKAPLSHTHPTGDIVGLGALALKAKAAVSDLANFTAGSKLVGSGSSGVAPAELSLGANLTMTGTTLAVTGVAQAGGSATATVTGAAVDITGIPAGVRRIHVGLAGVSTNGSSPIALRLGAGAVQVTGYQSSAGYGPSSGSQYDLSTVALNLIAPSAAVASQFYSGVITLVHLGGNIWSSSWVLGGAGVQNSGAGTVTLSGALDRLRLTTLGGTDTFDAGNFTIVYDF